jgi:glycosylphosphatidylinositol transamidase (GPIT) subunit GPI8
MTLTWISIKRMRAVHAWTGAAAIFAVLLLFGCATSSGGGTEGGEAAEARALIVAGGEGAEEPRHVADALMQYWLLRSRGLSDAEIVLVLPAWALVGPAGPPVVRSEVNGPNLRRGAVADLPISEFAPNRIAEHLEGGRGSLQAYVYVSGHGDGAGVKLAAPAERLTGSDLASALDLLKASHGGEVTMTAVIEGCRPDSFLDALAAEPDATVLSAAARGESSFATEYDRRSGTWLADEFTTEMTRLVRERPRIETARLLSLLRESVRDSAPQLAGKADRSIGKLVPAG